MNIGTRNRNLDDVRYMSEPVRLNSIGEANVRSRARFHRYRVDITQRFKHAHGLIVQTRPMAGRK